MTQQIEVFVDASVNSDYAAICVVVERAGSVLRTIVQGTHYNHSLLAEYEALKRALVELTTNPVETGNQITIYGDCKPIFENFKNNRCVTGSCFEEVHRSCKILLRGLRKNNPVSLVWIPRALNKADEVIRESFFDRHRAPKLIHQALVEHYKGMGVYDITTVIKQHLLHYTGKDNYWTMTVDELKRLVDGLCYEGILPYRNQNQTLH